MLPTRIRSRRRENIVSTAKKVWTRLMIIGLAACMLAALAAPASGQTLQRDGSKAVLFVTGLEPVAAPAADGFDWGDAAVGAAAALGLVALGGAGLALYARLAPNRTAVRRSKAAAT